MEAHFTLCNMDLLCLNYSKMITCASSRSYSSISWRMVTCRVQPEKPSENPFGNVRQDSGAFLLTTELFEHANQIVVCPITWPTCALALVWMLIGDN